MLVCEFCKEVTELVNQNNYAKLEQFRDTIVMYAHDAKLSDQLTNIHTLVLVLVKVIGHDEIISDICKTLQALVAQKQDVCPMSCSRMSRNIGKIQKRIKPSSVVEYSPLENLQPGQDPAPSLNSNGASKSEEITQLPGNRNGSTDHTLISQPETLTPYPPPSNSLAEQSLQEGNQLPTTQDLVTSMMSIIKEVKELKETPRTIINCALFNTLHILSGNIFRGGGYSATNSNNKTNDGGDNLCLKITGLSLVIIAIVLVWVKIWLTDVFDTALSYLCFWNYPSYVVAGISKMASSLYNSPDIMTPESVSNARANADGRNQDSDGVDWWDDIFPV